DRGGGQGPPERPQGQAGCPLSLRGPGGAQEGPRPAQVTQPAQARPGTGGGGGTRWPLPEITTRGPSAAPVTRCAVSPAMFDRCAPAMASPCGAAPNGPTVCTRGGLFPHRPRCLYPQTISVETTPWVPPGLGSGRFDVEGTRRVSIGSTSGRAARGRG